MEEIEMPNKPFYRVVLTGPKANPFIVNLPAENAIVAQNLVEQMAAEEKPRTTFTQTKVDLMAYQLVMF